MQKFQEIYQLYADDVYRFAYWLCGDPDEAEDITSKTFIRAFVKKSAIRTETLKAYLFAISRNYFLEQLRKTKHQAALKADYPDQAPEPGKVAESRLQLNRIRKSLQNSPETDRTAFVLRVQHGLPYSEIARILNLPLSTAKVKVHRIRKKLISEFMEKEVL